LSNNNSEEVKIKQGYKNEFEFVNYLNNKKYGQVNFLIKDMLKELYPNIQNHDIIKAYKYGKYAKTDVVINVNGILKGISIKSGIKNSVHVEPIEKFIKYVKNHGFIETDKLLRYLYSDGTNNNTGKERQSSEQYKLENSSDIFIINQDLKKLKLSLISRFLIKTDINYKVNVDLFINGSVNDFIWATTEEVVNYLSNNDYDSMGVHISSLFLQNWNKNLKYNPKYEYCRNYIQVKWYSMFDDIIEIMCNRNNPIVEPQSSTII